MKICLVLVTFKAPVMEGIVLFFFNFACADVCHLLVESNMCQ